MTTKQPSAEKHMKDFDTTALLLTVTIEWKL